MKIHLPDMGPQAEALMARAEADCAAPFRRIDLRVDRMIEAGLIDEVRALMRDARSHPTAMQAIGYKEIAAALEGRMPMGAAVELVKKLSRNYAKKQVTWFKRDPRTVWIDAAGKGADEVALEITQYLEEHP